ncbi:galactosyltransferase-related protein [Sphaerospermopsis kisseleviana CS-549]|uniref:Galactosyltransferase-related protein n=1 Tax=Sphaerospermopsis kisseleviana CS-549 TaxID=3021783 RepID=A0ABT4ZRY1_9CYAN|nr:galactosyltransferase-related protein [Sphaerospermopsis kisseleviana]MDB9442175.1 galactosyltransferase-related protein [Sphaerospermopsis kisseleviana CS-549]BAZ82385.1 hypothetical protein NIES73_36630 [Sphaerospermopsis kisseleviana NIES-73]
MVTLKEQLGCWLNERWQTELVLRSPKLAQLLGLSWLDLCNRSEVLQPDLITGGRICQWQFSSQLTVSRVFPGLGLGILQHVLQLYPVKLNFESKSNLSNKPDCSILFVVGGIERFPQFELALASARAQVDVDYEIIVVEQSPEPLLRNKLPTDVRYFHQVNPQPEKGFNKSSALNKAAREAKSEKLIILDADFVVPINFVIECNQVLGKISSARLARLIFYVDSQSTEHIVNAQELVSGINVEKIVENTPTPLALHKSTYWDIGGHDQDFWGWGGEDTEFLDRLRTCKIAEGGWLPFIHLWHPSAPKKANGDRNNQILVQKMTCSSQVRINTLKQKNEML